MAAVYRLIHILFAAYALGLIVYTLLSWSRSPALERVRKALERLYLPFLLPIRAAFKPVKVGASHFDFAPAILLVGIVVLRAIVFYVLFGRA